MTGRASPPLQQIHRDRSNAGEPLMLGVGMAGRSHWSLSVRLDLREGLVEFDVACRVKESAGRLASTYRLGEAVRAERNGAGTRLWDEESTWQIRDPLGRRRGHSSDRSRRDARHHSPLLR